MLRAVALKGCDSAGASLALFLHNKPHKLLLELQPAAAQTTLAGLQSRRRRGILRTPTGSQQPSSAASADADRGERKPADWLPENV